MMLLALTLFSGLPLLGYRRDFIKAFQICVDYSYTVYLRIGDGQTLNFAREKAFQM